MRLFFISFLFVILCTLHQVICDYRGKDVFLNNDCLWVLCNKDDHSNNYKTTKYLSDCRYNYENKEIYCELYIDIHLVVSNLYEKVLAHFKYHYRLRMINDGIEGNYPLKAGETFKSSNLQGKRGGKWESICLIGNYISVVENGYEVKSPFSIYCDRQRFVLTTKNNCSINFYFNKVYATYIDKQQYPINRRF